MPRLKRALATIALLFSVAVPSQAQIALSERYAPYEPILAGCVCAIPEGAEVRITWAINGAGSKIQPVPDSIYAVIGAPPGQHSVTMTVAWIHFEEIEVNGRTLKVVTNWDLQQYESKFTVGDAPTPPGPDPPGPDPDGPPDSKFGFAKIGAELVVTVTAADRERKVTVVMPDGNRAETRAITAVAAIYADVAARIDAGEVRDPQAAINLVKSQAHAVLGTNAGSWPDKFFKPLGEAANRAYLDGKVNTLADWRDVFNEIYTGLKHAGA